MMRNKLYVLFTYSVNNAQCLQIKNDFFFFFFVDGKSL